MLSFARARSLSSRDRIFTNLYGDGPADLASSRSRGDWARTAPLLARGAPLLRAEVAASGLRGRGGGGALTGAKWAAIPPPGARPHFLVVNGDESEPGTCKDRQLLAHEPHKVVEGALLAAAAIHAHRAYVYIRGEYRYEAARLQRAIDEAYAAGLIGAANAFGYAFDLSIHRGAGAYVCGEQTALLNSIEGLPGRPRFRPPMPALRGLFGCPTLVNNVETIASVPAICGRGGKWFAGIGVDASRGTKLFGVSGKVEQPCVVEEAMGIPMRELIEKYAGGVSGGWENVMAVIPGGSSCPILSPAEANEAVMSYECLAAYGSALGTGGIIVLDKSVDLAKVFARLAAFYRHESCGQCGPCREGTAKLAAIMERIARRRAEAGDLKELERTADATGNCICGLAGAAADPIKGLLKHFRYTLAAQCA
jgi:NADH:ubiquinone oxidoreductase subunit F (NADH-binding)